MKKFLNSYLLYIVLLGGVFLVATPRASAACQVVYGGGQMCQNQKDTLLTYKLPIISPTPTPLALPPTTTALPSTGASTWSFVLIGLSGIGGVLLLLL